MNLDLQGTERAIARYDALDAAFSEALDAATLHRTPNRQLAEKLLELEQAAEAVGYAFGEATKEYNNPETCRKHVRPGPRVPAPGAELSTVRRLVLKWRQEQTTPCPRFVDGRPREVCASCGEHWSEHTTTALAAAAAETNDTVASFKAAMQEFLPEQLTEETQAEHASAVREFNTAFLLTLQKMPPDVLRGFFPPTTKPTKDKIPQP